MTTINAGSSRFSVIASAVREGIGMPALVLFAGYIGFGSLVRQSDIGLLAGLVSTVGVWALPGQMVLIELYTVGASLVAIALAVILTNTRLTPMVITIMPLVRTPGTPLWRYCLLSQVIAVTSWANGLRLLPAVPVESRLLWFSGYAVTLFATTLAGTAAGYFLAGIVPAPVTLGLVFINPLYFTLLFAYDFRERARALPLGLGALLGPLLHLAMPAYGLLVTGVVAGTLAFVIEEALRRRERTHG